MGLTATAIKNAKPKESAYKLTDGGGLYLLVSVSGSRVWRYDYRLNGKRGTYSIGTYPDISLKAARERHREAREYVANGKKPLQIKQNQRANSQLNEKRFSYYAKQWFDKQNLAKATSETMWQRIDKNLIPFLDKKNVNEFTTLDLLNVLLIMSDRGAKETAIKMASVLRRVYNEILILGVVEVNPAASIAELLPKPDFRLKENFGHITSPSEIRVLLQLIDNPSVRQDFVVTQALKLMPLVFLRPKNIRFLKWEYIDFIEKRINIPASEMKTNKALAVPLAKQAMQILKDTQQLTGNEEYVFVSHYSKNGQPISENTTTAALKRLINPDTNEMFGTGYMTSHGFRHMASTRLNELGFDSDVIEIQMSHISGDKIRATYNKAELMDKRIDMMQSWADYLDNLKTDNNVISFKRATA